MSTEHEIDAQILRLFSAEAVEHLETINAELLALEGHPEDSSPAFARLLRATHSLKGTAATTGLRRIERALHNWESCVSAVAHGLVQLRADVFDVLFRSLDAIEAEIQSVCTRSPLLGMSASHVLHELSLVFPEVELLPLPEIEGGAETQGASRSEAHAVAGEDVKRLRVSTTKVDRLMTNVEELVQAKAGGSARVEGVERLSAELAHAVTLLDRLREQNAAHGVPPSTSRSRSVEMFAEARKHLEDASERCNDLYLDLRRHHLRLDQVAGRLQDDIRSVRMVPVRMAFSAFPRMVRDLSRALQRPVMLELEGGGTEVDRDLLDTMKDAVMHLLRNAVSHGLESAEERRLAGKPEEGRIIIRASAAGGGLSLTVSDDGRGINVQKVRERAVLAGLVDAVDAERLARVELEALIFHSGLSTADGVDSISGRGVGLDAVRALVERCGGGISLSSQPGQGTEFTMRLPLNLTSMRVLLVRVGSALLAVPINAVTKIVRVDPEQVRQVDGGQAIQVDGRVFPVAHLGDILAMHGAQRVSRRSPALLLTSANERAALVLDGVSGEMELIVKPLGDHLGHVPNIAGATVLSDGQIVPLLNIAEVVQRAALANKAQSAFGTSRDEAQSAKRVLIVDDSITTRTLEKSILEAVGFSVETATDGMDALSKLGAGSFDLVLSDVQMPRMDGIELVRRIRSDERFKRTPVVLVSSLNEQDDRRRGLEAGANAYLGKNEFRQDLLLHTLERLI